MQLHGAMASSFPAGGLWKFVNATARDQYRVMRATGLEDRSGVGELAKYGRGQHGHHAHHGLNVKLFTQSHTRVKRPAKVGGLDTKQPSDAIARNRPDCSRDKARRSAAKLLTKDEARRKSVAAELKTNRRARVSNLKRILCFI
jgi:hypothetical protein